MTSEILNKILFFSRKIEMKSFMLKCYCFYFKLFFSSTLKYQNVKNEVFLLRITLFVYEFEA